jgi:ribonucleoside-diphosphate reductase alpha chain
MRNSLLTSVMPIASTGQLLGNIEAAKPISSNMYVRRTLAGEFVVTNGHLMADLVRLGLWSGSIKEQIMANRGSDQKIPKIPDDLKELYRTVCVTLDEIRCSSARRVQKPRLVFQQT